LKGGKADPEDQAHVHVGRLADDAFLQDARGLQEHRQEQPVGDLALVHRPVAGLVLLEDRGERGVGLDLLPLVLSESPSPTSARAVSP